MTTLVDELEHAITCLRSPGPGVQFPAIVADELEARAAWLRELEASHSFCPPRSPAKGQGAVNSYGPCGKCAACVLDALTGPIPGETAPAAPKRDTEPRVPGCQCDKEIGDSPCRIHGDEGGATAGEARPAKCRHPSRAEDGTCHTCGAEKPECLHYNSLGESHRPDCDLLKPTP